MADTKGVPSCSLRVTYNGQLLQQVLVTRFLGLHIDERLQWSDQVDALCLKVNRKIGALRRSSRQLNFQSRRLYFISIIQSDLLCASSAYSHALSVADQQRIAKLSKSAVRAIFQKPPWTSTQPLFQKLALYSLSLNFDIKHLCIVYRFVHHLISPLFSTILHTRSGSSTRGSTFHDLVLPHIRHSSSRPFPLHAGILWNSLPRTIRTSPSLSVFKHSLLLHLGTPVRRP